MLDYIKMESMQSDIAAVNNNKHDNSEKRFSTAKLSKTDCRDVLGVLKINTNNNERPREDD